MTARVTGRVGGKPHLTCPVAQPFEMSPQLMAAWRQPVASSVYVLYQASSPKLPQPVREHARGHPRNLRRKLAVRQGIGPGLPQHPKRPTAAQHIKQLFHVYVLAGLP
jgi:hypothetical protein